MTELLERLIESGIVTEICNKFILAEYADKVKGLYRVNQFLLLHALIFVDHEVDHEAGIA